MSRWSDQIEADLRWREAELASIKMSAASAPSRSDRQRALLRALWTMLYAHYEGFSKFCWSLLLGEIERDGCLRSSATENLAILSMAKVFQKFRSDTSTHAIWAFVRKTFPAEMALPLSFPDGLETGSNLWPSLARSNNATVGITHHQIDLHEQLLKSLVGRRNEIAHGQKLVVESLDEYAPYEKAVMLVLHELALATVDMLDKRLFDAGPAG